MKVAFKRQADFTGFFEPRRPAEPKEPQLIAIALPYRVVDAKDESGMRPRKAKPDWCATAGKHDPQGEPAVFVSSTPLKLSPLEVPRGRACLTISPSMKKELDVLKNKLENLATDTGFNRTILSLPGPQKERMVPEKVLIPGKIRMIAVGGRPIQSYPPSSTTGSQGRQMEVPFDD